MVVGSVLRGSGSGLAFCSLGLCLVLCVFGVLGCIGALLLWGSSVLLVLFRSVCARARLALSP